MNSFQFISLMRMIYGGKKLDIMKIQNMGLLAVKIGQVHALRADFLKPEVCAELTKLYRANLPVKREGLVKDVDMSSFSSFNSEPLAVASVGQVYEAELNNGDNVVVKLIKKDFAEGFKRDVKSLRKLLRFSVTVYPKLKRVFDPMGILEHIEEYTLRELDLRNEREGQEILRKIYDENLEYFKKLNFGFPKIYTDLSSEKIMVSQKVSGKTFDELLDEGKLGYEKLLDFFRVHGFYLFKIGTFHGDIHPGNIMLDEDKIYFIDTGAISKVPYKLRQGLLMFFDALSSYDYNRCAEELHKMADKKISDDKFIKFVANFNELYSDFKGKTVAQISLTKRMMETIKMAVHAGMEFDKGMFGIIKSLMFLDGMVLRCNPDAVLMEDMRPYINEFL